MIFISHFTNLLFSGIEIKSLRNTNKYQFEVNKIRYLLKGGIHRWNQFSLVQILLLFSQYPTLREKGPNTEQKKLRIWTLFT